MDFLLPATTVQIALNHVWWGSVAEDGICGPQTDDALARLQVATQTMDVGRDCVQQGRFVAFSSNPQEKAQNFVRTLSMLAETELLTRNGGGGRDRRGSTPITAPPSYDPTRSSSTTWWILGGLAVAGAVATAVMLWPRKKRR